MDVGRDHFCLRCIIPSASMPSISDSLPLSLAAILFLSIAISVANANALGFVVPTFLTLCTLRADTSYLLASVATATTLKVWAESLASSF